MKIEILADKTLDSFERFLNSAWPDGIGWTVIIMAALYFLPVVVCTFCF